MTTHATGGTESEWQTRKKRIDPLLDAAGWPLRKASSRGTFRTEEEETANGPADYALWLDGRIVGIVEAKKLTIGPQNVLTQAERYARGLVKPQGGEPSTSTASAARSCTPRTARSSGSTMCATS